MTTGFDRRLFLCSAASAALGAAFSPGPALARSRDRAAPVSSRFVALKPSIFAEAQAANRAWLASLSPDRLLHNFRKAAGLEPRAAKYGGWESQSIAGHTLGHYLTACALLVENTGDATLMARLRYTVAELGQVQAAHGDGYIGGATLWGQTDAVDGKQVYERLRQGDIDVSPFALNGGWVPLYTWHKVHAGLLDAHARADVPGALEAATRMAGYLAGILDGLTDEQIQQVLIAEHGGLNDAFAGTYALTGDQRWLDVARRLRHRAVLDPLAGGRDELAGLHANTQIPKVIGLARLHELTGDEAEARTARFFHKTVVERHSYVIGGNSEGEHFRRPGEIARHVSETTCEACNTYNMLKLTRHLYGWEPDAALFDYYERAQLNHIMAHQRPGDGRFAYFMPLSTGARRSFSTPEDSFWCCVGSGMESHAKHADSIYWRAGRTLHVNLFIPSTLALPDWGLQLDLDTAYPADGLVRLTVLKAPSAPVELALRLPGWAAAPGLSLNGRPVAVDNERGYARLRRPWAAGDRIELGLDMPLRFEPTPDDPGLGAFVSGPLVLAADLGPADQPFESFAPVLVGQGTPAGFLRPEVGRPHVFSARSVQGADARFAPFFSQHDRRTGVYTPVFTPARWAAEGPAWLEREARRVDLARRTVDTVFFGEQQPEVDHKVAARDSEILQINGRSGRRIREGGFVEARLSREAGPARLRLTYWGGDAGQRCRVLVDGDFIGEVVWGPETADGFQWRELDLPSRSGSSTVRLESSGGDLVVYEVAVLRSPGFAGALSGDIGRSPPRDQAALSQARQ
ncbi:glycoside hydrolase family 127 protein [Brevundimonas sp.]|uniref:glycoside hydrolase family 127 protein n=1 Tax=Brevundimonas sp. TaxID=1871086 RepID=UPI002D47A1EE|nr:glycoside hydrolase family 127 protein [Brevundimonas sp.]HYC99483.1 glycoside hydrolase family 127 protein [Brevundimonas sp.]